MRYVALDFLLKGNKQEVVPTGSAEDLQNKLDEIATSLPKIFTTSGDATTNLNGAKLASVANAITNLEAVNDELNETKLRLEELEIWEEKKTEIQRTLEEFKNSVEEQIVKEEDGDEKTNLEQKLRKLKNLLDEIFGLNLAKERLKELIQQRIDDYGYDELENDYIFDTQQWANYIEDASEEDFSTRKNNLLVKLAKLIVDFWLNETDSNERERLKNIDNYLGEASDEEKEAGLSGERENKIIELRNSLKSQKGVIQLTIEGKAKIRDEDNLSNNRSISFDIVDESLESAFEDDLATNKLMGIEKVQAAVIYFNFSDDDSDEEEQKAKFEALRDQLIGWGNRKIVFRFDGLEKDDRKLLRIEEEEIHLDYDSYVEIEVSGGTELVENWNDISVDFDSQPLWKQGWERYLFKYNQVKEWIDAGLKLDEFKFAWWLKDIKKADAERILNEGDALNLRKEWLGQEIAKRLEKHSSLDWKAEEKYNELGRNQGHWGSDAHGNTWKEYLEKAGNLKPSGEDEFSYFAVQGGLLKALAELLFPEFVLRNASRNMTKKEIFDYMDVNCSINELNYYDNIDENILESKEKNISVRQVVQNLKFTG